ncbi:unnamed protein product [Schistosoma margrebowiei]|uniref:Uncharacterized protein n=1 Tax=Schistosoma margrebowiei TaxID=48269 RepID=A0A3P7YJR7_9TREM|nr:unnamed protein product [Schistosoma margrebowiei]
MWCICTIHYIIICSNSDICIRSQSSSTNNFDDNIIVNTMHY